MVTQQLLDYILTQRKQGKTDDVIQTTLLKSNWSEQDVVQAFEHIQQNIPAPSVTPTSPQQMDSNTKTIITVLLLLFAYPIGLIPMWFWTNWPKWVKWLISVFIIIPFLGILAAIVLVAVNPLGQIQKAQKAQCTQQCGGNTQYATCINTCMSKYKNNSTNNYTITPAQPSPTQSSDINNVITPAN